jgi:pullulanase/glycogen debranching enzyme
MVEPPVKNESESHYTVHSSGGRDRRTCCFVCICGRLADAARAHAGINDQHVPEGERTASVPGHYYRLDGNGDFYTSTCCPNTASEHRMFFKLMLDSLKIWAKHYLADGFRFDLMGFSFKNNMLEIKEALREIDPAIYLYGEGCDFGEVANNASKS